MGKPEHDPSIDAEPHLNDGSFAPDPTEAKAADRLARGRAIGDSDEEKAQHSAFDEPAIFPQQQPVLIERDWSCSQCGYNLRGLMTGHPCPECGHIEAYAPPPDGEVSYRTWFESRKAQTSARKSWLIAVLLLLLGGPFAVFGSLASIEYSGLINVVVFGPAIEEALKIAAALILVERRGYLVRSREQLWVIGLGTALCFAAVENVIYLSVFFPDPAIALIMWRWSVCVLLHMLCTGIAIQGVMRVWEQLDRQKRRPNVGPALPMLTVAIILHASYNACVFAWGFFGYTY